VGFAGLAFLTSWLTLPLIARNKSRRPIEGFLRLRFPLVFPGLRNYDATIVSSDRLLTPIGITVRPVVIMQNSGVFRVASFRMLSANAGREQ
jgi:hypothetical protein